MAAGEASEGISHHTATIWESQNLRVPSQRRVFCKLIKPKNDLNAPGLSSTLLNEHKQITQTLKTAPRFILDASWTPTGCKVLLDAVIHGLNHPGTWIKMRTFNNTTDSSPCKPCHRSELEQKCLFFIKTQGNIWTTRISPVTCSK